MSVGFYLLSDFEVPETRGDQMPIFLTKKDMAELGLTKKEIRKITTSSPVAVHTLGTEDETFMLNFDPQSDTSIEVLRDHSPNTISQYASSKFYYELRVLRREGFFSQLAAYLKQITPPFEIWKIWENDIDKSSIRHYVVKNVKETELIKIFDGDTFENPVVVKFR